MTIPGVSQDTRYVDLHLHTSVSDGTFSPGEIVDKAIELGFSAIAISDHDTVDGVDEAIAHSRDKELEIIPAVELSSGLETEELHILGYFIDHHNEELQQTLSTFRLRRRERMVEMIDKLREMGVNADADEFFANFQNPSIGRLHLAQYLISKRLVSGIETIFNKYLGFEKPAYAPKYKISPEEACSLIRRAGGVAVAAHPHLLGDDDQLTELAKAGIEGLEIFCSNTSQAVSNHFALVAEGLNLLVTGGSDCHQRNKNQFLIGMVKLPYRFVTRMRDYLEQRPT